MRRLFIFLNNIIFLLIALFLFRLTFFLKYSDITGINFKDVLLAFCVGLRFDLATAGYILTPVTLLFFIPFISEREKYLKITSLLSLLWLNLIIIFLFVDLNYYQFSQRHLTFEISNTMGDIPSIVKSGFREYFPEMLSLFFCMAVYSYGYLFAIKKIFIRTPAGQPRLLKDICVYGAVLLIIGSSTVVMARGGIQRLPLNLSDAYVGNSSYLGNLALNGAYTSLRTLYSLQFKDKLWWDIQYYPFEEAVEKGQKMMISPEREELLSPGYPIYRHYRYNAGEFKPLNVVIFMMESWTAKYISAFGGKEDATPYFSSLCKDGVILENLFANGQRSAEGISATLASIPVWGGMIVPINPSLSQMPVKFLPSILLDEGYNTIYIHGGKRDSLGLAGFIKQAGFTTHIAKEDIEKAGGRDDGFWGIYDEDTFQYAQKIFEEQKQPFFSVIYSLSSHTPYKVPEEKFKFYGKDVPHRDFLNSLRYSDYALSRFFEKAKNSDYFKNTIFVIVADHVEGNSSHDNLFESFHIPGLIYAPFQLKPAVIKKPVTQADLTPTILDILHNSKPHASIGISAFDENKSGMGLLALGDLMVFVKDDWLLLSSVNDAKGLFNYKKNPSEDLSAGGPPKLNEMDQELHYYLQFVHDLILKNRLFLDARK
ncbi:MAG: LTA synthase family protein [Nitrospirae bacterium]|nr:LTA synthase family protein [Nitrospirota bacterium]